MNVSSSAANTYQALSPYTNNAAAPKNAEDTDTKSAEADAPKENVDTGDGEDKASGLTSFTYGALGMDDPDKAEETPNEYHKAGQFVKAAATLGTILAVLI